MTLLDALRPLLLFCKNLDLDNPEKCRKCLEEKFPFEGEVLQPILQLCKKGLAEGSLCGRGELPMKFSRVVKPSEESSQFSVDAVFMSGAGPRHRHPEGEINLCIATSGDAMFDGKPSGWTVYGKNSVHRPTVTGGEMLILYLWPHGAFALVNN